MESIQLTLGDTVVAARADDSAGPADGGAILRGRAVAVRYPATARRFYRHGWQSWSQTRWLGLDEPAWTVPATELWPLDDDPAYAESECHGGAVVGALGGDGHVLLLGSLGLDGRVEVDGNDLVATSATADEWFVAYDDERAVFERYATHLGDRLGRRHARDLRVWSSWYSLYRTITEPVLHGIVDELDGFAFDVVQVDDGWQREVGDWLPNRDFPSGMVALADRIRRAGHRPGLWLAPFVGHERSQVVRDHPDWLLRNADGAPVSAGWNWDGQVHALDVTHPAALEHIADVIGRAVEWGYGYLKLDFIYAGALPGARHEAIDRHAGYRQAIERIRGVVGDDVVLVACGAPVIPSIGVFDAIRIGPDVSETWENHAATRYLHHVSGPQARYAVATSVHRMWLQPVIGTDPDVAYFRSRYCLLTEAQKALIADLTRACRFRATSDIPATLDPDEQAALAEYLQERPHVHQIDGFRWSIDGREVDFGPVATEPPTFRPL